ncbi:CRTAC1 family protein [Rubripirellula tenax]|nr:CRTAC1 family protein [Rubripirellula tenax]
MDSLAAMRAAVNAGQWPLAFQYSDSVLARHHREPGVVREVAEVARRVGQPAIAIGLLEEACRAESYSDEPQVLEAVSARISVGQLHDAMKLLEDSLTIQPDHLESRRWLFDFYVGIEQPLDAVPHGLFLIRKRKFDVELLLALVRDHRRTLSTEPLDAMVVRNPSDRRPLIGKAKESFDAGNFDAAIELLKDIVTSHQDYFPAQALLGRSLAAARRFDEFQKWSESQSKEIQRFPSYWIALGDWAREAHREQAAARAYWEAARLGDLDVEAFSKLTILLRQLKWDDGVIPPEVIASVESRLSRLSELSNAVARFTRTGQQSSADAASVAESLHRLGRFWEAEAWAAVATTMVKENDGTAKAIRAKIVTSLNKDTPWQLAEPYHQLDLSGLPLSSGDDGNGSAISLDFGNEDASASDLEFANEAKQRGLNFFGKSAADPGVSHTMIHYTTGCGGGTIDFDLDGNSDLYLTSAGGTPHQSDSQSNALMRNLDGVFTNVTQSSSSDSTEFGQGAAVGDVNEDGFPDLLVLNFGPDQLFINNGDGSFRDASRTWLPETESKWSTSGAIADVDGDGINDAIVVHYCGGPDVLSRVCADDVNGTQSCAPTTYSAEQDSFMKGAASGGFVDKTIQWGAIASVPGRGLGIVTGSFDDQPGVDVYVTNDQTDNHYFSPSKDETGFCLHESAMVRGLARNDRSLAQGSMGIAAADLTGDGKADLYVTNFLSEYNTFYRQRGSGLWQDQTNSVGLAQPTMAMVGWGTSAVDFDLNGTNELIVCNGHVDNYAAEKPSSLSDAALKDSAPFAMPLQIFQRGAADRYVRVDNKVSGEYFSNPHAGRALWTIDANGDDRCDVVVTHQTEPVALLVNHTVTDHHHLAIRLSGRNVSRDAVGTVVKISTDENTQTAFLTSGDGYMCSDERVIRFGLGPRDAKVTATVLWPDGSTQTHTSLSIDADWLIVQGDSPFELKNDLKLAKP